ncbi:MAG: hypothetical protein LWX54_14870 [Deltaproteobacteria bacterium]|nr:hypothetical protein [Deltaproteobacteria bacterium]
MIKVKLSVKYCFSKNGTALPSPSQAPGWACNSLLGDGLRDGLRDGDGLRDVL